METKMNDSFQYYSDLDADFSFREHTIRNLFIQALALGNAKEEAFASAVTNADFLLEKLFKDSQEKEG